jgi:hypothetical protein
MRRILCALLLAGALTGCGDDDGGTTDPTPDAAEPEVVQIVALSSAGGKVAPRGYFVDDRDEMKAYVKTFADRDDVVEALQQAVRDAGEREGRLAVATIAVGCDVPPGASVIVSTKGPEVRPSKIVDPIPECFAPTTSIALVEIPHSYE